MVNIVLPTPPNHCRWAVSLIVAATTFAVPSHAQGSLRGWQSAGQRAMLALTAVLDDGFELKNVTSKAITAFTISFNDAAGRTRLHHYDFFDLSEGVQPGGQYRIRLLPVELSLAADKTLWVRALVFDDTSSRGDDSDIAFLKARRLGRILETDRVNKLMQGSGSSSNSRLRDDLGRLPSSEDEVLKAFEQTSFGDLSLGDVVGNGPRALQAFLDGVRNVREEATNALRQNDSVGSGSDSEKQRNERVARLRQQFQDRGAKHQAYAAAVHNR